MAKVLEEVQRDGRKIIIYDNGLERDAESGLIVKPAPGSMITAQTSSALHRARKEKTSRLLREKIKAEHNSDKNEMTLVSSSAEAFAESGALLYSEIVLNKDAYPRDRLETWERLGKAAEVLKDKDESDTPQTVHHIYTIDPATAALLQAVLEARAKMPGTAQAGEVIEADAAPASQPAAEKER